MNNPKETKILLEKQGQDFQQAEVVLPVKKIQTFKDLIEEEQRLTMKLKQDQAVLSTGFQQLKAKIQPTSEALGYVSNIFGVKQKPGIIAHGVDMAIDLVAKKYLFKRSGILVTLIGSFAVRGLSQLLMKRKSKNKENDWQAGSEPVIDAQEARQRADFQKHNGEGL